MANNRKPVDRPKFILDTQDWTVRLYDDVWARPNNDLKQFGYGAISYAWGKWRDRTQNRFYDARYPAFDIGLTADGRQASWGFPIVRRADNAAQEQFSVAQVQAVFNAMGMRFVWWDWACIPQELGLAWDAEVRADIGPEMGKMRFVYPHAKRGSIWAHNISWADDSGLKAAIVACCKYMLLQGNPRSLVDVQNVVAALQRAQNEELWFKSLWCFQEGALFSHPNRYHTGEGVSVFRDRTGQALPVDTPRGEGDLMDLVTVASGIGATIINALRLHAEDQQGQPLPGGGVNPNFTDWCAAPDNEVAVRKMMDSLVATGLVFYTSQSPLSLLNARFNRERSPWSRVDDIEVNTVIGALEVRIAPFQDLADGREDLLFQLFDVYQWRMLLFACRSRANVQAGRIVPIWRSLVNIGTTMTRPPYTALEYFLATAHLADRFAPPPPAFEPPVVQPVPALPQEQFALPRLQYVRDYVHQSGVLVVAALPGFRMFQLNSIAQPLWTKAMFYDFVAQDRHGVYLPVFRLVEWNNWQAVFGAGAVLIPVEYTLTLDQTIPWERLKRTRCVVMSRFGNARDLSCPSATATAQAGVFMGVVDLERNVGGPTDFVNVAEGNLGLDQPITLF